MTTGGDIQLSEDNLMELKAVVSDWYDKRGNVAMLKVLYKDHLPAAEIYKASRTMHLLNSLVDCNKFSSTNLSLLYVAINVSKNLGLEKKIREHFPSFSIPANIDDIILTNLTPYRLKLMKLGLSISNEDVAKIDGLFNHPLKEHTESWSLILDLEKDRKIVKEDMNEFCIKLKNFGPPSAFNALCEDTPNTSSVSGQGQEKDVNGKIKLTVKRKQDFSGSDEGRPLKRHASDYYIADFLLGVEGYKNSPNPLSPIQKIVSKISYFFGVLHFVLENLETGSIVFHLSTKNQYALMNLWEIHSSGDLINDLSKILVPRMYQGFFLDGWMTCIDKAEYNGALRKLKEVECASNDCIIISNDTEWENQVIWDLRERRPGINYTIVKNWKLPVHEHETVNQLIRQSKKVIIGFSQNPFTGDYSKYAANDIVVDMLRGKTLDGAKVIPVKISRGAEVPNVFEQFNVINGWEEDFVDTLLQSLCSLLHQGLPILTFTSETNVASEKKFYLENIKKLIKVDMDEADKDKLSETYLEGLVAVAKNKFQLKKCYEKWKNQRRLTVEMLKDSANALSMNRRKTNLVKMGSSTVSMVGIVGAVGATISSGGIFAAGTLLASAVSFAAGATSVGVSHAADNKGKRAKNSAEQILNEDKANSDDFEKLLNEYQIHLQEKHLQTASEIDEVVMYFREVRQGRVQISFGIGATLVEHVAFAQSAAIVSTIIDGGFHTTVSIVTLGGAMIFGAVAAGLADDVLASLSTLSGGVTMALGAAAIAFEMYNFISTANKLSKGSPDEAAEMILKAARDLENAKIPELPDCILQSTVKATEARGLRIEKI